MAGSPEGGRALLIQLVLWIGCGITTVFMLLRVYAKFTIIRITGWSLVWALLATVSGTVAVALETVAVSYGFGNHLQAIVLAGGPSAVSNATKYFWLGAVISMIGTGLSKIAACAFLLEVQSRRHKIGRVLLWFVSLSNLISNIIAIFIILYQCNPPSKIWNPTTPGECELITSGIGLRFQYWSASWNAASDLFITLYPITIIWGLNITNRMKVSLSLLMSVSFFALASAIIKTVEYRNFNDRDDLTYAFAPVPIWDAVDLWVFLIVTSIPPLWPFFRFHYARITAKIHGRDADEAGAGAIQMSLYKGDRFKSVSTETAERSVPLKRHANSKSDSYAYFLPQDGIIMKTEVVVDAEERRKSQWRKSLRHSLFSNSMGIPGAGGIHDGGKTAKAEFHGEAVQGKI